VTDLKPADALKQHWTDALPRAWKPLAQLSRLDRPIGWQLLLLPCLIGLVLVRTGYGFYLADLQYAFAFVLGAIAMRGAGCTYNDILDRDIDAKVERTRLRPLPSGAVSLKTAWAWLGVQCAAGLVALLMLPPLAQIVALVAVPLVALYPLMKRITWWPQAWLGIVFSWGALVGGAAATYQAGAVPLESYVLYAGCICWTIAYDTIYALQDREDDALVGVRSTARLFGAKWRQWTTAFYICALFLWGASAAIAGSGFIAGPVLAGIASYAWRVLEDVDDARPETALAGFKRNAIIGAAVLLAFALEPIWRTVRPILEF